MNDLLLLNVNNCKLFLKKGAKMAAICVQNANNTCSVMSLEEFDKKFVLDINEKIISITERATQVVAKYLQPKGNEHQCLDQGNPSHLYNDIFYFVLGSKKYENLKFVYSFDLNKKTIKYLIAPLCNPHFFENLLVEFGSGFHTPGERAYRLNRTGALITVYDLTSQPGPKQINKYTIEKDAFGGWDGGIDEERQEIYAFDHVTGNSIRFPLFNKV